MFFSEMVSTFVEFVSFRLWSAAVATVVGCLLVLWSAVVATVAFNGYGQLLWRLWPLMMHVTNTSRKKNSRTAERQENRIQNSVLYAYVP
jgi:membrane protein implicated in regulation of membrane protease activity